MAETIDDFLKAMSQYKYQPMVTYKTPAITNFDSSIFYDAPVATNPNIPMTGMGSWGWQGTFSDDVNTQNVSDASHLTNLGNEFGVSVDPNGYMTGTEANISAFHKSNPDFFKGSKPTGNAMNAGDWFGAANAGVSALSGLYGIYSGNKILGLAKDQFREDRKLNRTNLFNQAQLTNSQLYDRQQHRNSMGSGMSTDDYMKKFGVRGTM